MRASVHEVVKHITAYVYNVEELDDDRWEWLLGLVDRGWWRSVTAPANAVSARLPQVFLAHLPLREPASTVITR